MFMLNTLFASESEPDRTKCNMHGDNRMTDKVHFIEC